MPDNASNVLVFKQFKVSNLLIILNVLGLVRTFTESLTLISATGHGLLITAVAL